VELQVWCSGRRPTIGKVFHVLDVIVEQSLATTSLYTRNDGTVRVDANYEVQAPADGFSFSAIDQATLLQLIRGVGHDCAGFPVRINLEGFLQSCSLVSCTDSLLAVKDAVALHNDEVT
jgi:hypothetical protein